MASREELYQKFGITAEAAQLFETELGTLLLGAEALQNGWSDLPDPKAATLKYRDIEKSTLGCLLRNAKLVIDFDDNLILMFESALKTRNRLFHGFFERHNFRIQCDEGRDLMIENLEKVHNELFNAWQLAGTLSASLIRYFYTLQTEHTSKSRGPVETIKFSITENLR